MSYEIPPEILAQIPVDWEYPAESHPVVAEWREQRMRTSWVEQRTQTEIETRTEFLQINIPLSEFLDFSIEAEDISGMTDEQIQEYASNCDSYWELLVDRIKNLEVPEIIDIPEYATGEYLFSGILRSGNR